MFNRLTFILVALLASGTNIVRAQDTKTESVTEVKASCKLETLDFLKLLDSASNGIRKTSDELGNLRSQLHSIDCDEGDLPHEVKKQMSVRCSDYFRHLVKGLQRAGIPIGEEWADVNSQANDFIGKMVKSPQWQQITSGADAQQLANSGAIVEAVIYGWDKDAQRLDGSKMGHLATLSPAPSEVKSAIEQPGNIPFGPPFVRDGNEHTWKVCKQEGIQRKLYPSSGGAVSVKVVFGSNTPICGDGQSPDVTHCVAFYAYKPTLREASGNLPSCREQRAQKKLNKTPKNSHTGLIVGGVLAGVGAGGAAAAAARLQQNQNQNSSPGGSCVTLPIACTQSSQCACGGNCADFGGSGICQPK